MIDQEYNTPDTIGPIILPNAANDCDIPLIRPKYFFSVELFIIKFISTTDNVANDPFIIKKIHEIIDKIVNDCSISEKNLTVILTPTRSLCGTTQVVGRVLEVGLHKVHELGFPIDKVRDGFGSAPLPPPAPDFLIGMGRTNDAILYGGQVHLYVDTPNDDAEELAKRLPSSTSSDYGKPFSDVFKEYKYDFYKIDKMLFSPAKVIVSSLKTGKSFTGGKIDLSLMDDSFNK